MANLFQERLSERGDVGERALPRVHRALKRALYALPSARIWKQNVLQLLSVDIACSVLVLVHGGMKNRNTKQTLLRNIEPKARRDTPQAFSVQCQRSPQRALLTPG
jgi:hypothetical protein